MSLFAQYPQQEMAVCPYSPLCQLGEGVAVAPFPRQTDRHTEKHSLVPQQQWEPNSHSSTSAVMQSSASLCSHCCYHLMLGPTACKPHAGVSLAYN